MVINKFETVELVSVEKFTDEVVKEDRGGGFGSTGKKEVKKRISRKITKKSVKEKTTCPNCGKDSIEDNCPYC